eukprot:259812-Chlamydomonas_euryale.AAC.1
MLVDDLICFPTGAALQQCMADMKAISGLEGCVGAIDGSFIGMKGCGGHWQHKFWCYKDFYSLTLLAIVDAEYKFFVR